MTDEDLFYTPGSIYNRERRDQPSKEATATIKRLHADLRELYEAHLGIDGNRVRKAMERAKNTLNWLEY